MSKLTILGISISEHKTDGAIRFENFCKLFNLNYQMIGEGKNWKGGNMERGPGGGQKINELKNYIQTMDNELILVCDTFDLIPLSNEKEILTKYFSLCPHQEILFSGEIFCWPDKDLKSCYSGSSKYRYLNSGGFMGYSNDIFNLLHESVLNDDDDQRFFTKKYLSSGKIIIDSNCEIFQAMNGSTDLILHKNRIFNKHTKSYPIFLHGNGPSKLILNSIENYLGINSFAIHEFHSKNLITKLLPDVFFALYLNSKTNYSDFIQSVLEIDCPSKVIHIYDFSYDEELGKKFDYTPNVTDYVFEDFRKSDCEYYLLLEQSCIITNKDILYLIHDFFDENHRIISPMMIDLNNEYFSNFWGDIDSNGYYRRSEDYLKLINYDLIGIWNVPYISRMIMIDKSIILNWKIEHFENWEDIDMKLCSFFRTNALFMYVINLEKYGYINNGLS